MYYVTRPHAHARVRAYIEILKSIYKTKYLDLLDSLDLASYAKNLNYLRDYSKYQTALHLIAASYEVILVFVLALFFLFLLFSYQVLIA
jgi:type III secretory pathway component EscU